MPLHYSGRKPPISYAFGWFDGGLMVAVITYGKPASSTLARGVFGGIYKDRVYELNRLCRVESCTKQLSEFVSATLRELSNLDLVIVSYADTAMFHTGFVYQACNFVYTGLTKSRTDKFVAGNKHSRHYKEVEQNGLRKVRSSKHRYIYFCTRNKALKKEWLSSLRYKIEPYPKTPNKNYTLGEYIKPVLVENKLD